MAGEWVFFLFLVIIIVAIMIANSRNVLNRRKEYLLAFEKAGYDVSDNYRKNLKIASTMSIWELVNHKMIRNWKISRGGVTFEIAATSTGGNRNNNYFEIHFLMPIEIRESLSLKITKRGFLSKFFGWNKGQHYNINEEFTVIGSNIMLVKFLFNKPKNLKELREAFVKGARYDLAGKSSLRISRELPLLLLTCKEILDLVNILRDFVVEVKGDGNYTVQEIFEDFNVEDVELSCIICYRSVDIDDLIILNCCSSVGHQDHLKTWLEKKTICPYCKKTEFKLLDPI